MVDYIAVEDLSKSLECVICHEVFHKPKTLPCHHTFCQECLDEMLAFNEDGSAILTCPYKCNGDIIINNNNTTNSLSNNYIIQDVLVLLQKSKSSSSSWKCQNPNNCTTLASMLCECCCSVFCQHCSLQHKTCNDKWMIVRYHQRDETWRIICNEHQRPAKWISDCGKVYLCIYCCHRTHKNHTMEIIKSKPNQKQPNYLKCVIEQTTASMKHHRDKLQCELQDRQLAKVVSCIQQFNRENDETLEKADTAFQQFLHNFDDNDTQRNRENFTQNHLFSTMSYISFLPGLQLELIDLPKDLITPPVILTTSIPADQRNSGSLIQSSYNKFYCHDQKLVEDYKCLKRLSTDLLKRHKFLREMVSDINAYTWTDMMKYIMEEDIIKLQHLCDFNEHIYLKEEEFPLVRNAAGYGKIKSLQVLLTAKRFDVNLLNTETGYTALHWACQQDHFECVKLLLEHDVDITIRCKNGKTAGDLTDDVRITRLLYSKNKSRKLIDSKI